MKRNAIRLFFATLAFTWAVSCGPDPVCPGEIGFVGNYDGEHQISLPLGVTLPTGDSLFVTDPVNGDNMLSVVSQTLNSTLTCRINSNNCNKVIIDTVRIDSANIEGITIKNVVAAGDGDINGNQLVTRIKVISGTAEDIPSVGDASLAGTRINGIFKK